jgi:hypothetical protein
VISQGALLSFSPKETNPLIPEEGAPPEAPLLGELPDTNPPPVSPEPEDERVTSKPAPALVSLIQPEPITDNITTSPSPDALLNLITLTTLFTNL